MSWRRETLPSGSMSRNQAIKGRHAHRARGRPDERRRAISTAIPWLVHLGRALSGIGRSPPRATEGLRRAHAGESMRQLYVRPELEIDHVPLPCGVSCSTRERQLRWLAVAAPTTGCGHSERSDAGVSAKAKCDLQRHAPAPQPDLVQFTSWFCRAHDAIVRTASVRRDSGLCPERSVMTLILVVVGDEREMPWTPHHDHGLRGSSCDLLCRKFEGAGYDDRLVLPNLSHDIV